MRNQTSPDRAANEAVTKFAKRVKQNSKQQAQDIEMRQWEEKQLHEDTPIEGEKRMLVITKPTSASEVRKS